MTVVVKELSKIYGNQKAVDNISFEAGDAEILGFLGPNGAGKSTTMKMITGYLSPSSGTISVAGIDISADPLAARAQIGYLPETNPLYQDMYVKEYLEFVASIRKLTNSSKRISDVIEMTGLQKEQHKIIGTLSKGYKQRVGLAQALMHDPRILILDEPTSGLDMNQLEDIRNVIRSLGKEKTIIFSTHIMQEVQQLCERVLIISDGRIVADDPIDVLQKKVAGQHILHLQFLADHVSEAVFEKIDGVHQVKRSDDEYLIYFNGQKEVKSAIFSMCVQHNYPIGEMREELPDVEAVFRKLTKPSTHVKHI